jgi:hypothetical protein
LRGFFVRSTPLVFQIGIPARLDPLGFSRHLRVADVLTIMLTSVDAGRWLQLCGKLSGEYSPVFSVKSVATEQSGDVSL